MFDLICISAVNPVRSIGVELEVPHPQDESHAQSQEAQEYQMKVRINVAP